MGRIFRPLLDLLFPRLCVVCGGSLVESETYICSGCLADFPLAEKSYNSVLDTFSEYIRPAELHSLFYYNKFSNYKNLIYAVKYQSRQELGIYLGRLLGTEIQGKTQADCIVPVPLHPKRERERGYNQAYLAARGIQEVLGLDIYDDVVYRIENNVSQTGKTAGERRENVENVFELRNPHKIEGKHILLVDDVITTGATIGACMLVLSGAGNVRFSLACLAQSVDV